MCIILPGDSIASAVNWAVVLPVADERPFVSPGHFADSPLDADAWGSAAALVLDAPLPLPDSVDVEPDVVVEVDGIGP